MKIGEMVEEALMKEMSYFDDLIVTALTPWLRK